MRENQGKQSDHVLIALAVSLGAISTPNPHFSPASMRPFVCQELLDMCVDPALDEWDPSWRERLQSRWPAAAGLLLMRLAQVRWRYQPIHPSIHSSAARPGTCGKLSSPLLV